MTTYDRLMKDKKFKKAFDSEYEKFLRREIYLAYLEALEKHITLGS